MGSHKKSLCRPLNSRNRNMYLKLMIFTLSFLTTSAFPFHRNVRQTGWTNSNQANDKTDLTKDMNRIYKSHIDSSDLYSQEEDDNKNPIAEEMHHKLNIESERLRARLRQELSELRERLSSSPAHLSSTVASMRERLAPLTQQLQSSLSSNIKDLCDQLSVYLQALETAEAQAEAGPALYQEAFQWMNQTLEHSSSKLGDIISDFHTKTIGVIEHMIEISASEEETAKSEFWLEVRSRLGQEVSSLSVAAQNRMGVLKADIAALLETVPPVKTGLIANMKQFCQNATLQNQVFQTRMERLFQELVDQRASSLSLSSSSLSIQPGGSLQGDFSDKLSALIQDIMLSVQ